MVDNLLKVGVKILHLGKIGKKLQGITFVLTGALETMTRLEAQKKIRLLGGHPAPSVSSKTDYLVVGLNPSSKLDKAEKLGVKIIKEKEFLSMLS